MSAAKNLPPSITCRQCFAPPVHGRNLCTRCAGHDDDKLHALLVAWAEAMKIGHDCAEHAASEAASLAKDPHEGLARNGPGFFERASQGSPFISDPPPVAVPIIARATIPPGEDATRYGRAVLGIVKEDLAGWITAGEGRNCALFKVASRLARLADAGHVDRDVARAHAERISEELCPDERAKATDTVRRAFRVGGAS